MNPTYTALLSLLRSGNGNIVPDASEESNSGGSNQFSSQFSVRIKPESKAFLDMYSEKLGLSKSALYGMIVEGVISEARASSADKMNGVYERFCLLMDANQLSVIQQAQLLAPFGISSSALSNAERTLDLLNMQVLRQLADWFGVDVEWLCCESNYPISGIRPFNGDGVECDSEIVFFRCNESYLMSGVFTRTWRFIQNVPIPYIKVYMKGITSDLNAQHYHAVNINKGGVKYFLFSEKQVESLLLGSVLPVMIIDNPIKEYADYSAFVAGLE
ncbi:helix-turn-helix domain-containing protein [Dickeya fangzhongdai]|uniref:helix-turn-helix domain-containing protein n=1 Tax=Dickeya fangzhongdai TaxID=1778540 RepID=UPI001EFA35D8|nr:helix-turn-helix transcriptional regulator [Dickeya fangzhongdai]ULR31667.1 helix-turn-helix domain-containing protein [Dickeya fangzhongdai]